MGHKYYITWSDVSFDSISVSITGQTWSGESEGGVTWNEVDN